MKFITAILLFAILTFGTSCGSDQQKTVTSKNEENTSSNTPQEQVSNPVYDQNQASSDDQQQEVVPEHSENRSALIPEDSPEYKKGMETTDLEVVLSPPLPSEVVQPEEEIEVEEDVVSFHEYEKLNKLLSTYVTSSGKVNYKGIKAHKSELEEILKEFQDNYPQSDWTRNQKMCYWINAYNIFTIKLVVDNYPVTSITKINGGKPWNKKFIKLGGNTYSLDYIENSIVRPKFKEPRVHFALNCASKSCPVLLNKAYSPGSLNSQLTSQTKKFLNDSSKNKFSDSKAQISKIFEWYKSDFDTAGGVIAFVNKYRSDQLKSPKITYLEYSWDLNE